MERRKCPHCGGELPGFAFRVVPDPDGLHRFSDEPAPLSGIGKLEAAALAKRHGFTGAPRRRSRKSK